MGRKSKKNLKVMGVFSETAPECILATQGIFSCGGTLVPLRNDLSEESLAYILNQTCLVSVVCSGDNLTKLIRVKDKCPHLKNAIIYGKSDVEVETHAIRLGMEIIYFNNLIATGDNNPSIATPGTAKDTAMIMYTYGSSGIAKGAMLSHENILVAAVATIGHLHVFDTDTIYLAHLPLSNTYEMMMHFFVLNQGGSIGFVRSGPLLSIEDIIEVRPTVVCCQPEFLNMLYSQITSIYLHKSVLLYKFFQLAIKLKQKALITTGSLRHLIWDRAFFNKIRVDLGLDRCKAIITGSGAASSDILNFFRVVLLCPVVEGYGLTETCGVATFCNLDESCIGTVGRPIRSYEIKLISSMNYNVNDTKHYEGNKITLCKGRGEIAIRGPSVCCNYYSPDDELHIAVSDVDGWFYTGDIGMWTPEDRLIVLGRKENVFQIACSTTTLLCNDSPFLHIDPLKVESSLIANSRYFKAALVYGDREESFLVAIFVPNWFEIGKDMVTQEKRIFRQMAEAKNEHEYMVEMDDHPVLNNILFREIQRIAKKNKTPAIDKLTRFLLFSNDENNFPKKVLTANLRLHREKALAYFAQELKQLLTKRVT